ncbi:hypothetical protein FHW31_001500 [Enterobacter asburiae]|uniref:hypothetical protein n=1 Tax=Enterobacter asburiae TaxID=61645 RepID=UPI00141ADF18|nr:hypothetical protein [Enterobacter asburiae]NIH90135.1 hypothetical protein [Enterobacter asburiae]
MFSLVMPEQFVVGLYVSVSLSGIQSALYKIAYPLLTIVDANVPAIVTHNILDNGYVTGMRMIVYQAESSIDQCTPHVFCQTRIGDF